VRDDRGDEHVRHAPVQPDGNVSTERSGHGAQPRRQHELEREQRQRDDAERRSQLEHERAAGQIRQRERRDQRRDRDERVAGHPPRLAGHAPTPLTAATPSAIHAAPHSRIALVVATIASARERVRGRTCIGRH
jgi:hypothetical protein